jgi:16S rRNA (guanine966-N2)-methyltransferase
MRITTGEYKGRIIKMPKGIRPTQDKVRKALFDILGDIKGLSFLDGFAGSGAVGLEAVSRGAREVVFLESSAAGVKVIKENLALLGCPGCRVMGMDAHAAIKGLYKEKARKNIIFFDPPYYKDLATPNLKGKVGVPLSAAKKTLQMLGAYDILAPNGFAILQHYKKDDLPEALGDLRLFRRASYGDTVLSFYQRKAACAS